MPTAVSLSNAPPTTTPSSVMGRISSAPSKVDGAHASTLVEYACHPDRIAALGILGDAIAAVEVKLLEHPERRRIPLPHGRPQPPPTRPSRGFDDRTRSLCGIPVTVSSPCKLIRDLRFVKRPLADDQSAVPNELPCVSPLDRQQPQPRLRGQRIAAEPPTNLLDRRTPLRVDPPYRTRIPLNPQPAVLLGIRHQPSPQSQPLSRQLCRKILVRRHLTNLAAALRDECEPGHRWAGARLEPEPISTGVVGHRQHTHPNVNAPVPRRHPAVASWSTTAGAADVHAGTWHPR